MNNNFKNKIPITIITGFLGAGKTSFLKYMLKENHGKRIVIIENEFGEEIGIEGASIIGEKGKKNIEWVELPNGCICCAVKNDLLITMENIVRKENIDYILIEPSGLADPGTLASIFWVDEELESNVYLDGIITIIDAKHILYHLNEKKEEGTINEAERQIAFADRIIINKKDLISEVEMNELEKRIKNINSISPIYKTERSRVPLNFVFYIQAFDSKQIPEIHLHNHEDCLQHIHDSKVNTISLIKEIDVDLQKFHLWIGNLVWNENSSFIIFRYKGMISVKGENEIYSLQGVHSLFEIEPSGISWGKQKRFTKLVFIGKGLNKEQILDSFNKEFF